MFFAIVKEKGEMPNAAKIETVLKHVEKISIGN
jgi:hypothetical protein